MLINYGFLTLPTYLLSVYSLLGLCKALHKNNGALYETVFGSNTSRMSGIIGLKAFPFKIGDYQVIGAPEMINGRVSAVSSIDIFGKSGATIDLQILGSNLLTYALRIDAIEHSKPIFEFSFSEAQLKTMQEGRYTDYPSFSEYTLYLPFIGYENIDYYYILNSKSIDIKYYADYAAGNIVCNVEANISQKLSHRIKEYSVPVAQNIPLTYTDYSQFNAAMLNMASVGASILTTSLLPTGTSTSRTITTTSHETSRHMSDSYDLKKLNKDTGRKRTVEQHSQTIDDNTSGSSTRTSNRETTYSSNPMQSSSEVIDGLSQFYNSVSAGGIHASGNQNTYSNSLTKPFIIVKHPEWHYYDEFPHNFGRLLGEYRKLSELHGFTKFSTIHINVPATFDEINEIESLLKGGVIITTTPPPTPPEPEPQPPEPEPQPPEPEPEPVKWLSPWSGSFRVTSPYGVKRTYTNTSGQTITDIHKGLDMVGIGDTTIYSIADGTVEFIGWQSVGEPTKGFGYYCRINTNGKLFYYGHMKANSSTLKVGDSVSKGTKIGTMGATGNVTGAHLHLEVRDKATQTVENICSYTLLPNSIGTYE